MKLIIPYLDVLIRNQRVCLLPEGRSQNTINWYENNLISFLQLLRDHKLSNTIEQIIPDHNH